VLNLNKKIGLSRFWHKSCFLSLRYEFHMETIPMKNDMFDASHFRGLEQSPGERAAAIPDEALHFLLFIRFLSAAGRVRSG
jgi:hypothetical protein